jgi:hypothetical protein
VQHRVRHPVERGGVQRQPLGRRDLVRRYASLDGQGLGGHRLRLGGAEQRLGQPQPDQGDLLLPRLTSSPMLNVLASSASSCATSRTTAPPPGAPPRLMPSNATYRGRANILKRPNRHKRAFRFRCRFHPYAARQLAELLAQRGDLDGLRVLADAADEYAAWLAEAARRAPSAEFADPQKTGTTRKVCATCGSQLTADDLYCGECGTSTRSTKSGRSLTS